MIHFAIFQLADDRVTYGPDAGKYLVTSANYEEEFSGPMSQQDAETFAATLNACQLVVDRWEKGDLAEAARACGRAVARPRGVQATTISAESSSRAATEDEVRSLVRQVDDRHNLDLNIWARLRAAGLSVVRDKPAFDPVANDEGLVGRVARAIRETPEAAGEYIEHMQVTPSLPYDIAEAFAKAAIAAIESKVSVSRQPERRMWYSLSIIARMKKDGEEGFELTNDDAVDSLHSCIELARNALSSGEAA